MFKRAVLFVSAVMLLVTIGMSGIAFSEDLSKIKASVKKHYPKFTIDDVRTSPIKGIYEITSSGQIFYYHESGHMIFGEIWSPEGKSLTGERRAELRNAQTTKIEEFAKSLSLDKGLKLGNGKHLVIEFTDPDCPYCRKGHEYFAKRSDVTRVVYFMPLEQIHPQARKKAAYMLCAADKHKAVEDVFSGKMDNKELPKVNAECAKEAGRVIDEHVSVARMLQLNGTPAYLINGKLVRGADFKTIEALLKTQ